MDWVGQWLMYPNRGFPAAVVDHAWVDQGRPTLLLDHKHPLLVIGHNNGVRTVQAYRPEFGGLDILPLTLVDPPG